MFYKKPVLKNFAIVSFFIKLQAFRPKNINKRPQYSCFPVNIAKFSKAPILKNINLLLMNSIYLVISPLKMQRRLIKTKAY